MTAFRMASLCFVGSMVFAPLSAYSQGPPIDGPGAAANLSARVQALEELVATLQSAQSASDQRLRKVESGQVTAADLVGTYAINSLGIEMNGFQPGPPAVNPRISTETGTENGTVTLNANGTVSASTANVRCTIITGFGGLVGCGIDPATADPLPGVAWTVNNGKLIITEVGDETAGLLIGAGGRVLIAGGSSTGTANHSWANIFVLVRLPNP